MCSTKNTCCHCSISKLCDHVMSVKRGLPVKVSFMEIEPSAIQGPSRLGLRVMSVPLESQRILHNPHSSKKLRYADDVMHRASLKHNFYIQTDYGIA